MTGVKQILVGFLLVGLFVIGLLNFGIMLPEINGANQSISQNPAITNYFKSINSSVKAAPAQSQSAQEGISEPPSSLDTGVFYIDAMTAIPGLLLFVPMTIWNLTVGLLLTTIFSSDSFAIILSVVGAILGILIVLGIWRLLSTGESD